MLCVDIRPASVDPVPHAAINPRSTTSSTAVPETGKPSPPRACRARNLYPRGPHQHRVRDISTIAVNVRSELPAWPRHGGSTRSASNLMPWTTASLIADGVLFERPLATGAAAPMGGNPSPRHPRAAHRSGLEGGNTSRRDSSIPWARRLPSRSSRPVVTGCSRMPRPMRSAAGVSSTAAGMDGRSHRWCGHR